MDLEQYVQAFQNASAYFKERGLTKTEGELFTIVAATQDDSNIHVRSIAELCGYARRTVSINLTSLRGKGLICFKVGFQGSHHYQIKEPEGRELCEGLLERLSD